MSKAVLISIQPKWCELIASGKKTIEVRKTAPKIKTPFKCYIYCTKDPGNKGSATHFFESEEGTFWSAGKTFAAFLSGTVIGEFVCDKIYGIRPDENGWGEEYGCSEHDCLSDSEMLEYLGDGPQGGFGWHISDLVIYDEPKKMNDFMRKPCDFAASCGACNHAKWLSGHRFDGCELTVTRPPQSFCYVEELT